VLIYLRITSVAGRLYIWRISSNIVDKNNFLTGIGLNRFNPIYMIKQGEYLENNPFSPFSMLANNTEYCFNEFFQSFIETGMIGLVLLVCIILSILFIRNKNKYYFIFFILISIPCPSHTSNLFRLYCFWGFSISCGAHLYIE